MWISMKVFSEKHIKLLPPEMPSSRVVKGQIVKETSTFYSVCLHFLQCEHMTLNYFVIENYEIFRGWNASLKIPILESQLSAPENITVFRNKMFKEVIKLKWGPNPIWLVFLWEKEETVGLWEPRGKTRGGHIRRQTSTAQERGLRRNQACWHLDVGF